MTHGGSVRVLLFISSNLFLLSYKACEEAAHQFPSCVPVTDSSPSFLGYDEWIILGIFLFVVASGFIVSAFRVFSIPLRMTGHLVSLQLENRQKIEN